MSTIYLATLGQRPEAITVALDILLSRQSFERVAILHTEPQYSGIAEAYNALKPIFKRDYPQLMTVFHQLTATNGGPLLDIDSQSSANAYYNGTVSLLRQYIEEGYTLHLMVAGGRKAMTLYASLAASMLFRMQDRLWTLLTPPQLMKRGHFHIPPKYWAEITLVRLPIIQDGVAPLDFGDTEHQKLQQQFLNDLSDEERRLVDLLCNDPNLTYAKLAAHLDKKPKTVEHQFSAIYKKLENFVDLETTHKKRHLLNFLQDEG